MRYWVPLAIATSLLFGGCSSCLDIDSEPTPEAAHESSKPSESEADEEKPEEDLGDFKIVYGKTEDKFLEERFSQAKVLEELAGDLNKELSLPFDITVTLEDCGEVNAFYDPGTHSIQLCYELIHQYANIFSTALTNDEDIEDAIVGSTVATFYHEVGHALVDVLKLPVVGKEEDAVDQLATVILIDYGDHGQAMAIDGAMAFVLDKSDAVEELPFWGAHALNDQRFYNMMCLVYGSDPEKFEDMVKDGVLPEERAEGCGEEFEQAESAWTVLLAPYTKSEKKD